MMSSVTHKSLDPVTVEYKGPALANWNMQVSSLAQTIKNIHAEFEADPPMPKQMTMAGNAMLNAL